MKKVWFSFLLCLHFSRMGGLDGRMGKQGFAAFNNTNAMISFPRGETRQGRKKEEL